jgi:hypothetical protein
MKTHLLSALATLALAAAASAQAGGFTTGDIWESNDATAVQGHALLRIDPLTGTVTSMHASPSQNGFGGLAFDTYRHRLIWRASVAEKPGQHIWMVDGAGVLTDTGLATSSYGWFAPAGDGRIFCIDNTGGPHYAAWIDAANRVHRVLDPAGLVPYQLPAGPFPSPRGMAYDSGTNALYACSSIDCDGLGHQQIVIGKLSLSADGTRVTGAPTCASFDTTPAFLEFPTALAHLPDGRLLVTTISPDVFPYTLQPALLAFDPASMSFSAFAMVGNLTTGKTYRMDDGVWSSVLNKAVVLDTFKANLRTWAPGESGDGSVIVPSAPIAVPSAEAEQIAEISPASCSGAWVPYSVGLAGKGGFVPALVGSGCPVPGGALTLKIADVVGGAGGSLFVGLAPAAVPFKGGVFAVGAVTLTAAIGVGGASGVAGAGTLDLPAALPANPLLSGLSVFMQGGFSDAAAVKGVSLTQGLQMEIG